MCKLWQGKKKPVLVHPIAYNYFNSGMRQPPLDECDCPPKESPRWILFISVVPFSYYGREKSSKAEQS
jgi:hypothetical protein